MLEFVKKIIGEQYTEEMDKELSKAIGERFVSKEQYRELTQNKQNLDAQLEERDKQLEELSKVDAGAFQSEIEKLKEENEKAKVAYETELKKERLTNSIEKALLQNGAKNMKAVKALISTEGLELLNTGEVKGLHEQLSVLKEGEDTSFLFQTKQDAKKQFQGAFQPASSAKEAPSEGGYQAALEEARKSKNTVEAIRIKQEALQEGIILT